MNQHVSSGVCNHSTPTAFEEYMIFCVGQDPYKIAAFKSWATGKFGFKSLVGSYNGQLEQSFIANARHLDIIKPWTIGEESILHLSSAFRGPRRATLRYNDGREEELGHFIPVNRKRALAQPSWTYDPTDGEYYICKK